jgi:hypothetical protein
MTGDPMRYSRGAYSISQQASKTEHTQNYGESAYHRHHGERKKEVKSTRRPSPWKTRYGNQPSYARSYHQANQPCPHGWPLTTEGNAPLAYAWKSKWPVSVTVTTGLSPDTDRETILSITYVVPRTRQKVSLSRLWEDWQKRAHTHQVLLQSWITKSLNHFISTIRKQDQSLSMVKPSFCVSLYYVNPLQMAQEEEHRKMWAYA